MGVRIKMFVLLKRSISQKCHTDKILSRDSSIKNESNVTFWTPKNLFDKSIETIRFIVESHKTCHFIHLLSVISLTRTLLLPFILLACTKAFLPTVTTFHQILMPFTTFYHLLPILTIFYYFFLTL